MSDIANLHLGDHVVSVPIPATPATLLDLLPSARELTNQLTALTVDASRAAGRDISCRAGCGACCRQLVAISIVEAESLARLVESMPAERQAIVRQRFADAVRTMETMGLLDPAHPAGDRAIVAIDQGSPEVTRREAGRRYFAMQVPCPFLEDESCGIHPERPMVCREYHVTSPAENCSRLYELGVDRLLSPVRMSEVMARTGHRVAGLEEGMIPLTLSLEWSARHRAQMDVTKDGMELFRTMIGEIDPEFTTASGGD
jgi:Fe-S-cluster containining protein